jgi:DNA-binding response OmpR family regulator
MKKILVVDDEVEVLNVFERFLDQLGYDPEVLDKWEEALELFQEEHFDLVILDVHMPGKDGFQIAKEMKELKPEQKILMITGLSAGDAYQYLSSLDEEFDVNEVLYKPFTMKKVKKILTKILNV